MAESILRTRRQLRGLSLGADADAGATRVDPYRDTSSRKNNGASARRIGVLVAPSSDETGGNSSMTIVRLQRRQNP